jgi:hypothetical protein
MLVALFLQEFNMRFCAKLLVLLLMTVAARADEQPAAPAESPALTFARKDAARLAERMKSFTDKLAQATAQVEAVNKAVADAKSAQADATKALADADAAMKEAEKAKAAAEKALADAIEKRKQAEAIKSAADKKVPEAEQAVKPATDAKAAIETELKPMQDQLKLAEARVAAYEKESPKAVPSGLKLVQTITHDRPIVSCAIDPTGDYLFAGAQDNNVHRWDLYTGSAVHATGHKSWVGDFAFLPAGGPVLSAGQDGKLIWWSGNDPAPAALRTTDAHKGFVRAVAVSPDGKLIATGGNDNLVKVWSAENGELVKEIAGHDRHVYNVEFHPSGKWLVSGDLMGVLKQWDTTDWSQTRELDAKVMTKYDNTFKADCGGIRGLEFSPDGKYMVAAGITEVSNAFAGVGVPAVALFEWESGKRTKLLKPKDNFQGTCWGVKFHPSGEFLVAAGGGGSGAMWFWKVDDEKSFFDFKLPNVAYDLAWHPDGLRLAVGLFDKTVKIYDLGPKVEVAAQK